MHRTLSHWLAATFLAAATHTAAAPPPEAPQGWSRLRFEHAGLAITARLDITRNTVTAADLPATDASLPGALRPSGEAVGRLLVRSYFELPPLLHRRREAVLWFEPASYAALLGTRETSGIGAGYRVSRYATDGVHVANSSPANRTERESSPGTWTAVARSFLTYGSAAKACTVISEPVALLLLDPASLHEAIAGPGLCVISKKRLHRVMFSAPVEATLEAHYKVHAADGTTTPMQKTRAWRYSFRLRPAEGDEGASAGHNDTFLGLSGDVQIHVDAVTGTPLRLSGNAPLLGRVEFRLRDLWPASTPAGRQPSTPGALRSLPASGHHGQNASPDIAP